MTLQSERQFNSKATTEAFDEIYTNHDVSVNETYLAQSGYPFDYPTRWLNDPSMNKRIAVRRLDVLPSTHSFTIQVYAEMNESGVIEEKNGVYKKEDGSYYYMKAATFDVPYTESLIKVLNYMCQTFSYEDSFDAVGGLSYKYDVNTNRLILEFKNTSGGQCKFSIDECKFSMVPLDYKPNIDDMLKFLNQPVDIEHRVILSDKTETKIFDEVWTRDRLYFHASFSTSRRKFIGKCGDFYQTLTLLYPSPTNESTFYIRFTSNGIKNILIRHCEFDIQLCYIVNFKKAVVV